MRMPPKAEVCNEDVLSYIRRRRADAMPLMQIPKADARVEACAFAICVSAILLRRQISRIRARCRRSKREDVRQANKILNQRPENVARRKRSELSEMHDPEKLRKRKIRRARYYEINRATWSDYRKSNPEKYSYAGQAQYFRDWQRNRRRTDPQYNIGNRLRSRVWHALAREGVSKATKTEDLVGCTVRELRIHIEGLFSDGMSWEKFMAGKIHLDHIRPCASFDLTDPAQQKLCFHFSNLQPLWAIDNLSKGARLPAAVAA